jgi:sugar phosphate isomerase/epimerase
MRLGGPIHRTFTNPEEWSGAVVAAGYGCAYAPVGGDAGDDLIKAYVHEAKRCDIVIAEVGAWSNPLDPDPAKARVALEHCKLQLALADRLGARCCVNIAGAVGNVWCGPAAGNFTEQTFDRIVAYVREILDDVKPTRTFYTLETMPWAPPDSVDNYLLLIKAIDRKSFGVHFDPVNLITDPRKYFGNAAIIRDFTARLGPHIRSCHAKDLRIDEKQLAVQFSECRPGTGVLDYPAFLTEVDRLDSDMPVLTEHLASEPEYVAAAEHIRGVAGKSGVTLRVGRQGR